jgi:UDP-N-acetylmuramoylalanine--D-glutamate ligase
MRLSGTKVLVVGLGKSGVAAARLLLDRGARVIGNDLRAEGELPAEALALREQGATLVLGGHDQAPFTSVDRIVVSPGIPALAGLAAAERAGVSIASEIELASWFIESTLIGVTGTNGKSTVTTLVGEMCRQSGRPTFVGGNLGTPLAEAVSSRAAHAGGYVVVELSSFQLERVEHLRVHYAALLNVTPDHLDRYDSLQAYARTKANIFRNQRDDDIAVVPSGDALCADLARTGGGKVYAFGGSDGAVRMHGGAIRDDASGLSVPLSELRIAGRHNHDNACAAALLARLADVPRPAIEQVLRTFPGLPHRMVLVRRLDEVDYFDDSKATNVGAAAAALDGLSGRAGKVVLIAGGRHKGGDYGPIAERMRALGRGALLIGEATELMTNALRDGGYPVEAVPTLQEAVVRAQALAEPGDAVLLAPACSSFDMFRSYAQRGEVFAEAVLALPAKMPRTS